MQARQSQIDKLADQQQATALIIERVVGRLDALEHWREDQDERRERQEERRDTRDDKRPELSRADLALFFSAIMALVYVLQLLAPHWK